MFSVVYTQGLGLKPIFRLSSAPALKRRVMHCRLQYPVALYFPGLQAGVPAANLYLSLPRAKAQGNALPLAIPSGSVFHRTSGRGSGQQTFTCLCPRAKAQGYSVPLAIPNGFVFPRTSGRGFGQQTNPGASAQNNKLSSSIPHLLFLVSQADHRSSGRNHAAG